MAAYPSYDIFLRSAMEEESGVEDDFAESGPQHSRIFHSQSYYRFSVYHMLTLAQLQSLHATYAAGKRDDYTLTFYDESPQQTYTVKFLGPPQRIENIGNNRFIVEVPLRGTAD